MRKQNPTFELFNETRLEFQDIYNSAYAQIRSKAIFRRRNLVLINGVLRRIAIIAHQRGANARYEEY